jgi:2-polyprenyl-3-methyl-5-hydroxy-6-metoxy-1,4-benzoquinol methylase
MENKNHWEQVYTSKANDAVSWFQANTKRSVELINETKVPHSAAIIDVGSGASHLIDDLISQGFNNITALDLSAAALASTKERLGQKASSISFIVADITQIELPRHAFDVWHDRAVFHFLTEPEQRRAYVNTVLNAVKPGGHIIMATFAEDGPQKCSGLPVQRYAPHELHAEFGAPFELVHSERETHYTPFGTEQKFIYCYCRKVSQ